MLLCLGVFGVAVVRADDSEHDRNYYCVTACMSTVDENNCGADDGLTSTCTSYADAAISDLANVATPFPSSAPAGFLGCSASDCDTLCSSSGVTDANPIKYMSASKAWCFEKDKTMFSHEDQARMSALARGCAGSHAHGAMHMHGDTHEACESDHSDHSSSSGTFPTFLFGLISASAVAFALM